MKIFCVNRQRSSVRTNRRLNSDHESLANKHKTKSVVWIVVNRSCCAAIRLTPSEPRTFCVSTETRKAQMKTGQSQKKKPAAKPQIKEYAGNLISTNYWLKIGLAKEELLALRDIAQLFEHKQYQTPGHALRLVATTALMHWDKIEPFVFSDRAYSEAEGFGCFEIYRRNFLAAKFNPTSK